MSTFFCILSFVSICTLGHRLHAQQYSFITLTEENILDKQSILSIAQDTKGRLWFGGQNNIFIYDSYSVTNLLTTDTSMPNIGYIIKIAINAKNDLFIATADELYVYRIDERRFLEKDNKIIRIPIKIKDICSHGDKVLICTHEGLHMLRPSNGTYSPQILLPNHDLQTISPTNNGQYVIATTSKIEFITNQNDKVNTITSIPIPISVPQPIITSIFLDDDHLWMGTKHQGVFRYDMVYKKWINLNEQNSDLLSNNIRKIIKDSNGRILIGTLKGLSTINTKGIFENYKHNPLEQNSLSQNSIYDIFIDNQQVIWFGTYYGGMNAVYPRASYLTVYSTRTPQKRLNSDIIGSFAESEDAYWIGTEEEGLTRIDKKSKQIVPFPHLTKSNLIKDVFIRYQKLYVAQYAGGYSIIDLKNSTSQHFNIDKDSNSIINNVFSIFVDDSERIYLGTNIGPYVVEHQKEPQLIDKLPVSPVIKMDQDRKGKLYLLQASQLYHKTPSMPKFTPVPSTEDFNINGFFIDEQNTLWFTSQETVYKQPENDLPQKVASFQGNNLGWPTVVNSKLWITSKNGLIYFDLNTKYQNILTQYDGLPVTNLQSAKVFIAKDLSLFLLTFNGLVSLDTEKIRFNTQIPRVLFKEIKANDQLLLVDRMKESNSNINEFNLDLNHDENFITVSFSSSNFIIPKKNRYRYKLEGFDKDWKETTTPVIQYTNLPQGNHLLTIFASNNDMVWSNIPLKINITVFPPFWKTWWAYLLYVLIVCVILYFVIKFIVEREILKKSEKEHEKKIKFFTQISHEIRTPLTLITAPLDDIIQETAHQNHIQQKLIRMKKNANKLLGVVNELLDFKKFDEKKQTLRKTHIPLNTYIEDSFYLLSDLAQTKNLNYYIRRLDNAGFFPLDTIQFDKVMFNLLSNAIKYTLENGTVYLELIDNEKTIEIRIVDNGIGVSEENQFKIFEEYYRQDSTEDVIGTGIGLALTKKIIERHGGDIACRSMIEDEHKWTIFSIHFEKKDISDFTDDIQLTVEESIQVTLNTKHDANKEETILIVEDNKELLETIADIFQVDHQVVTANNGEEGLKKAREYMPDIILSDMMMPKMNGLELCQALKDDVITSHIPFILLTAVNDQSIHTQILQYGANIYLTKPFDKGQLYLSVRNLLAISKQRRKDFKIKVAEIDNKIDRKFIDSLDQLIEEHLTDDGFDVNYISRAMGMSAPILYRKLKAITDLSLNNYVKSYRLNKAKELLSSQMNISEIAYAVGFSDRKYFSKEFKKLFGVNPSEYDTEK